MLLPCFTAHINFVQEAIEQTKSMENKLHKLEIAEL